jgi:hypothetical protein
MDRAALNDRLEEAERQVVESIICAEWQRALVDRLIRSDQDAADARVLLSELEKLQTLHVADRDRVLQELVTQTKENSLRGRLATEPRLE